MGFLKAKIVFTIAAAGVGFFLFVPRSYAATFTVNSTEDTSDGTCVNPYAGAASDCTFREAVLAANASAGADTITFDIGPSFADDGNGQWTISLTSAMTALSGPTTLTAASAWDADHDRPGIKIERTTSNAPVTFGAGAVGSKVQGIEFSGHATAITITANSVTVGTDCDGVLDAQERNVLYGAGMQEVNVNNASGTVIRGNYFGVRSDGLTMDGFGLRAIQITGAAADGTLIGYQEGTSATCAAALQRNVFGGGNAANDSAIIVTTSTTITDDVGNATLAPDHTVIAGNYLGLGADGVTDVAGTAVAVRLRNGATLTTVGTDGDGMDDALEGNVISGWGSDGVVVFRTGGNRVSGNVIGLTADQSQAAGNDGYGILVRGQNNVVGWCDANIDAVLCSDAGADGQGNVVGSNAEDGIRFGSESSYSVAFGNRIGTDGEAGSDFGNAGIGLFVHRGNLSVRIGASGEAARNVIRFNAVGVKVDGFYTGSDAASTPTSYVGPTEDYRILNNRISDNDADGIWILGTEQDGTVPGPIDGTVEGNQVSDNGASGILIEGSSPLVSDNELDGNAEYGVNVRSSYRHDDPESGGLKGTIYEHPTDTLNPGEAAQDFVSKPTIVSNAVDGNALGGILILDADAENMSTLDTDNDIGTNGTFDVRRDWYAAIELLNFDGGSVTAEDGDGSTVTLTPANGAACTGACATEAYADAGGGEGVWGPAGISYEDATTWFQLTDVLIDPSGSRVEYNPYRIQILGDRHGSGGAVYQASFDGDLTNDTDTAGLPSGIETSGIGRYQVHEFLTQTDSSDVPPAVLPTPLDPVAISADTIRWYFHDNAQGETAFRILLIDDDGERVVADSGIDAVRNLDHLDETGLEPDTEYCHRFVVAVGGTASTVPLELPCAKTLATGEMPPSADQIGTPDVVVSQAAFLVSQQVAVPGFLPSALAGLGVFGTSIALGHGWHWRRRRLFGHHAPRWHMTYGISALIGLAAAILSFLFFSCPGTCFSTPPSGVLSLNSVGLLPVTSRTDLQAGDHVRLVFEIANVGNVTATGLSFADTLPNALEPDADSVARGLARLDGQNVTKDLDDLVTNATATVRFDAVVREDQATIENFATVIGENVPGSRSNVLSFRVVPLPPDVPGIKPFVLYRAEGGDTLYMIDTSLHRRPFPNDDVFYTWYESKSFVRTVSDEQLAEIPLGPPMLPRSGTRIIKSAVTGNLYAVEPGQLLRRLRSEGQAEELYGEKWKDRVLETDDVLFGQFAVGDTLDEGEIPDGHLFTDGKTICYMVQNRCRETSQNGLVANRFFSRFLNHIRSGRLAAFPRLDPITTLEPGLLSDE